MEAASIEGILSPPILFFFLGAQTPVRADLPAWFWSAFISFYNDVIARVDAVEASNAALSAQVASLLWACFSHPGDQPPNRWSSLNLLDLSPHLPAVPLCHGVGDRLKGTMQALRRAPGVSRVSLEVTC